MDLRTDQMLATAFAAGELDAFAALYDRHAASVYAGACIMLGPGDAAGSVVVSVFQRLARDVKRRRRYAEAPTRRLDRLTRDEVRRRGRVRAVRLARRSTDGLDRTLPPRLRTSVMSVVTAPSWRPSRSLAMRFVSVVPFLVVGAVAVVAAIWVGQRVVDRSSAVDGVVFDVNPTITSPIGSTSVVAVLPPVPANGAQIDPATGLSADPAPGLAADPALFAAGDSGTLSADPLQLSSSVVEVGAVAAGGTVVLRNTTNSALLWAVDGNPAPFVMLTTSGVLEAGQETTLGFVIDRTALGEGTYEVALNIVGPTVQPLLIRAEANVAPQVVVLRVAPQLLFVCDAGSIQVAAQISDDSPIAAATVSWIGPGAPGSAAMSPGNEWLGTITPDPVAGSWAYSIQAVDSRGNQAAAVGTFQVSAC